MGLLAWQLLLAVAGRVWCFFFCLFGFLFFFVGFCCCFLLFNIKITASLIIAYSRFLRRPLKHNSVNKQPFSRKDLIAGPIFIQTKQHTCMVLHLTTLQGHHSWKMGKSTQHFTNTSTLHFIRR
jgi:hypothetical protein